MSDDLAAAAFAARYLAGMVASIRALKAEGASEGTIKRFTEELDENYPEAQAAIDTVAGELRLSRGCRAARFGDLVAPTSHEIGPEMVRALNRERFRHLIKVLSYPPVRAWPDVHEVVAEIELEITEAKRRRELEDKPREKDGYVSSKRFRLGGHIVDQITPTEMLLMETLWGGGECPEVTAGQALRAVYGKGADQSVATIKSHAKNLRAKVQQDTNGTWDISVGRTFQLKRVG